MISRAVNAFMSSQSSMTYQPFATALPGLHRHAAHLKPRAAIHPLHHGPVGYRQGHLLAPILHGFQRNALSREYSNSIEILLDEMQVERAYRENMLRLVAEGQASSDAAWGEKTESLYRQMAAVQGDLGAALARAKDEVVQTKNEVVRAKDELAQSKDAVVQAKSEAALAYSMRADSKDQELRALQAELAARNATRHMMQSMNIMTVRGILEYPEILKKQELNRYGLSHEEVWLNILSDKRRLADCLKKDSIGWDKDRAVQQLAGLYRIMNAHMHILASPERMSSYGRVQIHMDGILSPVHVEALKCICRNYYIGYEIIPPGGVQPTETYDGIGEPKEKARAKRAENKHKRIVAMQVEADAATKRAKSAEREASLTKKRARKEEQRRQAAMAK